MRALTPTEASAIAHRVYDLLDPMAGQAEVADDPFQEVFGGVPAAAAATFESEGFRTVSSYNGATGFSGSQQISFMGCIARGTPGLHQGETLFVNRGTVTGADWATDAQIQPVRLADGTHVHKGFNDTFGSFKETITDYVRAARPSHVHCVGHSLGGALATLVAHHIKEIAPRCQIKLYSFGCPRVGLEDFSSLFERTLLSENIYRVYHDADVVSMVPMYPFFHTPAMETGYCLNWRGGSVSAVAHKMESYKGTINGASDWLGLLRSPSQHSTASVVEGGLVTAVLGPAMYSAALLAMIYRALSYILSRITGGGARLPPYATTLDTLAWMLHRSAAASIEMSMLVTQVIAAIFRFLGRTALTGAELTTGFIRWVLGLLFSGVSAIVSRSIAGLMPVATAAVGAIQLLENSLGETTREGNLRRPDVQPRTANPLGRGGPPPGPLGY